MNPAHRSEASEPRRARVSLHAVVGCAVALAAVCAAVALPGVLHSPRVHMWQVALLLCMLPLSELALVHIRFGSDRLSFTWGEGCLLVGFAIVNPSWLVLLAGPTVMLVHLLKGRGITKAAFNGAAFTISASAGALVLMSLTSSPYYLSDPSDALGLGAAGIMFSLTSAVCTGIVVSVAQSQSLRQVLLQ